MSPSRLKVTPTTILVAILASGFAFSVIAITVLVFIVVAFDRSTPLAPASSAGRDLTYCRAIVAIEEKYPLTGDPDLNSLASKCSSIFKELQSLPASGVDPQFLNWTNQYSQLLIEMKNTFDQMAADASADNQTRLMIEAFMRGYQGDPFGTAVEESQRNNHEVMRFRNLNDQRLLLLGNFARMYNQIAPPGSRMSLQ
jgi:hypothetical protein